MALRSPAARLPRARSQAHHAASSFRAHPGLPGPPPRKQSRLCRGCMEPARSHSPYPSQRPHAFLGSQRIPAQCEDNLTPGRVEGSREGVQAESLLPAVPRNARASIRKPQGQSPQRSLAPGSTPRTHLCGSRRAQSVKDAPGLPAGGSLPALPRGRAALAPKGESIWTEDAACSLFFQLCPANSGTLSTCTPQSLHACLSLTHTHTRSEKSTKTTQRFTYFFLMGLMLSWTEPGNRRVQAEWFRIL